MAEKPSLDTPAAISRMVDLFYQQVLADPQLRPIFVDVAGIELESHLSHIRHYWCKLLLGDKTYQRHTMNIHRELHARRALTREDFQRWLTLFTGNVRENFSGKNADRAVEIAQSIASNMQRALHKP